MLIILGMSKEVISLIKSLWELCMLDIIVSNRSRLSINALILLLENIVLKYNKNVKKQHTIEDNNFN